MSGKCDLIIQPLTELGKAMYNQTLSEAYAWRLFGACKDPAKRRSAPPRRSSPPRRGR